MTLDKIQQSLPNKVDIFWSPTNIEGNYLEATKRIYLQIE